MVSVKTRRLAVPVVVVRWRAGSAAAAHAQSGGLSVTPASLENRAKLGTVGSLTLNNTTSETLRVTVTVRPWQQQLNGTVVADPRSNLTRYVRRDNALVQHRRRREAADQLPHGAAAELALRERRHPRQADQHQAAGIIPELPAHLEAAPEPGRRSPTTSARAPPRSARAASILPAAQPRQLDRPDQRALRSPAAPPPSRATPPRSPRCRASSSA